MAAGKKWVNYVKQKRKNRLNCTVSCVSIYYIGSMTDSFNKRLKVVRQQSIIYFGAVFNVWRFKRDV
jgi:hypothetical protein